MPHYQVRPGFYVHRNNSVLSPGAIIEAEPEDVKSFMHQLEEVEVKQSTPSRTTRKPKDSE